MPEVLLAFIFGSLLEEAILAAPRYILPVLAMLAVLSWIKARR